MTEIKELIEKYSKLLPVGTSVSYTEAERRAGEFLYAIAQLANYKHELGMIHIRAVTGQTATYAEQMSKGTAKTVTENKLTAEASKEYIVMREDLENIENDISYIKAYMQIFTDGHLFYRSMAKEGKQ